MVHTMVSMMLLATAAAEDIVALLQISAAVRQQPRKQALVNAVKAEAEKKAAAAMAMAEAKKKMAEAKMTEAEAVDLLQEDLKKGQIVSLKIPSATSCARDCDDKAGCLSFEYSPTDQTCKLNSDRIPTKGTTPNKDYKFCSKQACQEGYLLTPGVLMGLGKIVSLERPSATLCAEACDKNARCLSFEFSLKDETCNLNRDRIPTCPEGYSLTPEVLMGLGKIVSLEHQSATSCAEACDELAKCPSFEYSLKEKTCNLNRDQIPTKCNLNRDRDSPHGVATAVSQTSPAQVALSLACKDLKNQEHAQYCNLRSISFGKARQCRKKDECAFDCCHAFGQQWMEKKTAYSTQAAELVANRNAFAETREAAYLQKQTEFAEEAEALAEKKIAYSTQEAELVTKRKKFATMREAADAQKDTEFAEEERVLAEVANQVATLEETLHHYIGKLLRANREYEGNRRPRVDKGEKLKKGAK